MNPKFQRRSAISNCISNSTLLGSTDISEVGQTVTGAIRNLNERSYEWKFQGSAVASTGVSLPDSWNEVLLFGVRLGSPSQLNTGSMTCIIPYDLYAKAPSNSISILNHTGSNYPQSGVHAYSISNNVVFAVIYSGGRDASSSSAIWVWYR